jgi:cellulose synthase/poly-beta-1,6-N-acetylglucosamine synthase-like glycosyltransferase
MPASDARSLLVIPAFNEARSIGAVVDRVRATDLDLDVLVVNDGSRDETPAIARAHGAIVVSHPFNLGYGAALQTGYKYALRNGYGRVVQMDADGQHDPAYVPRLLEPVLAGEADVVIGSRFVEASGYEMSGARSFGRAFLQRLLVWCGGPHIADPTSGLQALSEPVVRFCCSDFYPFDFPDIDVLLLLHRQGFRIREIPVTMAPSPPLRKPMHAGLRAVYYPYKMLLSTFRSWLTPRAKLAAE